MQEKILIHCDTREQKNQHVLEQFEALGIGHFTETLSPGDYTLCKDHSVIIDRKQDVLEIASNICGKDHERFKRECIKAQERGIKLIILIEEQHDYNTLCEWKSPVHGKYSKWAGQPMTKIKGLTLAKAMATMQIKYGVSFKFCNKDETGKKILELLGVNL